MNKISVIIPVYNVEKYIRRCVESVLSQTYDNLEIILVDDGSTDSSPRICDEYASKDDRILVIHQSNGGLSAARNTGIEASTTDCIAFVDSDDEILPTMIETLLFVREKTGADITQCAFKVIRSDADLKQIERNREFDADSIGEITVSEGIEKLVRSSNDWKYTVQWNKLYSKSIFEYIRYPVGKWHEDEWVIHREAYAAKKIASISRELYLYYKNTGGITTTPNMKRMYDSAGGFFDRMKFYNEKGYDKLSLIAFRKFDAYIRDVLWHRRYYAEADKWTGKIKALHNEGLEFYMKNTEKLSSSLFKADSIMESRKLHLLRAVYVRLQRIRYKAERIFR